MARKVKEFILIDKVKSLDGLIEALVAVRERLPQGADADAVLRGCDVFGRHIAVCYQRPQTAEEAECEARYADAYRQTRERQERERAEEAAPGRYGHLRAVA